MAENSDKMSAVLEEEILELSFFCIERIRKFQNELKNGLEIQRKNIEIP